jgi:peptidoglycan/LPS O-acetylase OafA/YrhL
MTPRAGEIRALTSLRGIAALYIVLLHFSVTAQRHATGRIPALAPDGVLAVDLFFVLSGFIMAYTYLDDFTRHGMGFFPSFLARRFARIMPLNIAVLLLIAGTTLVCLAIVGRNPFPFVDPARLSRNLLTNILLLQGLGIGENLNGPSWSISDECIAYLIFPALLSIAFHRRLVIAVLACMISVAMIAFIASKQPNFQMDPTGANGIYWDIVRCVAEFTLGLAVYRVYRAPVRHHLLSSDAAFFSIVGAIALIILLRGGQLFTALLFPPLILAISRNKTRGKRLLECRPLYFLGVVSYSIYLIHNPIRFLEIDLVLLLHPDPFSRPAAMGFAALGAASVILPAWITYRLFEQPGRNLFRRLLGGIRRRAPGSIPL